ncbi:MAG: hypothetical protein ABR915_19850 [Thermoguttaceae bacterium]|jgi:hypothetical protein
MSFPASRMASGPLRDWTCVLLRFVVVFVNALSGFSAVFRHRAFFSVKVCPRSFSGFLTSLQG